MHQFLDSFSQKIFPAALILRLQWQFLTIQPFHTRCSLPRLLLRVSGLECKQSKNLVDLENMRLKIDLLDPQTSSSKFTLPRGCSECHLDNLGNCGVRKSGCSLISTCSYLKCFWVGCRKQLSDDELFLYRCCDSIESNPESDPATVSDLYLNGGLVSRLASPFFVLLFTSPHLALSLLVADYFTAIATTSVPLSGHYSSESSTPALRLAKMLMSAIRLKWPTTH